MSRGKRYSNNNNNNNFNNGGMGGDYFEADYAGPSRYYTNRGGNRGGGRKNAAPRFCYVNADFLGTHGLNEFQQGGYRRRGGWDSNRYQIDNRFNAAASNSDGIGRDSMIADISVTVPTGGKRVSSAEAEDDRDEDYGNKRKRHKSNGGGGGGGGIVRKSHGHKRHRKPVDRKRHHPSGDDSGDGEVEVINNWSEGEDEDLRLTIVRQKMKSGKNNNGNNSSLSLRREPGEILDTDEGTPASSPEGKAPKAVVKRGKAKSRLGAQVEVEVQTIDDDGHANANANPCNKPKVGTESQERPVVESNSRPITAETLSQDTLPSVEYTSLSVENKTNEESQHETESVPHNDHESPEDSANTSADVDTTSNSNSLSAPQDSADDDVVLLSPTPDKEKSSEIGSIDSNAYDDVSTFQERHAQFLGTEKVEGGEYDREEAVAVSVRPSSAPASKKSILRTKRLQVEASSVRLELFWRNQAARLKKDVALLTEQLKAKDEVIAKFKIAVKEIEEKESKIKVLRGRKTLMENEIEELKKSITKLEKQSKEADLKCKRTEAEIKKKNEELEGLKRNSERDKEAAAAVVDPNKPDVQLIYAMAYQDRLYVEVEKVKSAFEVEILKLQEYYESRLAYFRNHGVNPGPFMGPPGGNSFPKGCVVTPLNMSQSMAVVNDQGQGMQMQRGENRSNQSTQMGMFAHLGQPDSITSSMMGIPSLLPRGRMPMFLNPMFRRMQQPMESITGSALGNGNSNNSNTPSQNASSSNSNATATSTSSSSSQQQGGQAGSGNKSASSGSGQNAAFTQHR